MTWAPEKRRLYMSQSLGAQSVVDSFPREKGPPCNQLVLGSNAFEQGKGHPTADQGVLPVHGSFSTMCALAPMTASQ